VPFISRHKVSATFRFHTELPNDRGELALAPTISYQSHQVTYAIANLFPQASDVAFVSALFEHGGRFNCIGNGGCQLPGYWVLDLRGEWNHIMGSRFDAAINVQNATNNLYQLGENGGTLNFGGDGVLWAPRGRWPSCVSMHGCPHLRRRPAR
jgi:outer membrane receptor protein involved in Fe transport